MNKIVFKTNKNNLIVANYNKDINENINDTNIINTKEIYFSTDYIKDNLELVASFLNVIILKQNINKVTIKEFDNISITLDIIKNIPSIKELSIKCDNPINYDIFLKLLDNNYLESIDVYDIPNYLLERLDLNKNININIRSEILFISNFMESNKLTTYSDIYYKKNILINKKFDEYDKNDFLTFIKINKYLRLIEFTYYDQELFELIIDELLKNNLKNIKIIFNQEYIDINKIFNDINRYKNKYEKVLELQNISFKINYSDKYKKDNMFKQINLNFIKVSLLAIILVVTFMMSINIYRNYKDDQKSENIERKIDDILKVNNIDTIEETPKIEYIEPNGNDKEIINSTTTSIYDLNYALVFDELLAINNDTVAYLKVNNTNINYPVVLGKDNDYYLKRDYYKNKNRHGWIFMDYRNNIDELDRNTIIYGHNLANQKMFGTLRYVLNSSWYKKTSNQIITFNTINENMTAQIFSIYKVPVTTDYLKTDFANDNDYLNFIKMIKDRSIYDFNVEMGADDKILTLSTCSNGSEQRLVVHAKIIKK